jgi:ribosomal protein L30
MRREKIMTNTKTATGTKVIVRQTRSRIGRNERIRATLNALGLGHIGQEKEHTLTPSVTGMIEKVKSIVRVRKA